MKPLHKILERGIRFKLDNNQIICNINLSIMAGFDTHGFDVFQEMDGIGETATP